MTGRRSGPCPTPKKDRYRDRIAATLGAARIARNHPASDRQEPYPCGRHWHTRTVSKRRGAA